MYSLQLNDRLSESLLVGFDKTIFAASYGDMVAMAGPEIYNQIIDRTRTWETPMYYGEAEIMLLRPLAKLCISKKPNLTQELFARAAAFGIIEEIAKLSSTRDMSSALSKDTIMNHPVIQQLMMMGVFNDKDMSTKLSNVTHASEEGPNIVIDANPKEVMSIITNALSGAPIKSSSGSGKIDVVTLVNALYSMGSLQDAQDNFGQMYADLQQTMKMGKRYPMQEEERRQYFDKLVLPILNWLANASRDLFQGQTALDSPNYDRWADFLIVSRWFSFYLDCVERYDEVFPTQLIPTQSQMQVIELQRAANKFKGIYMKLTQSTLTACMTWSLHMWENLYTFFTPFFPPTAALTDLRNLMNELKVDFDSVKDPWAESVVSKTIERMITLSGVDVLLDKDMTSYAMIPQLIHNLVKTQSPSLRDIPTGADALAHLAKYSLTYNLPSTYRDAVLTMLSKVASSFNSTTSAMMQAVQFITRDYKLPILQTLLPDYSFEYTYPAKPLSLLPQKADFTRKDETVRTYAPWVIKDNALRWVNLDKINTIVRVKDLQDEMVSKSPSTIYWPPIDAIKVGEPHIAIMAKQPVLATYTQNVTSDMVPPTWSSWFKLWANHNPEMRPENVLSLAATALAQDMYRNEGPIATCFAPVCAIAAWKDDGKIRVLTPNIAWIYGVPFDEWLTANHVIERVDTSHGPSLIWSAQLEDDLSSAHNRGMWYTTAHNLSGETYHFCFAIWKVAPGLTDLAYPEMDHIRYSLDQLVKGAYFCSPARREYFSSKKMFDIAVTGKSLLKEGDVSLKDDGELVVNDPNSYWQAVKGFCPVVLTLPHLTWDMATSCQDELEGSTNLLESMFSYVNIPVRYKFNDYDKSYSFVATYNNPPVLVEYSDYESEASSDRHLPTQTGTVQSGHPVEHPDAGAQAPEGENNAAQSDATLSTSPEISSTDNATLKNPLYKVTTSDGEISHPSSAIRGAQKGTDKDGNPVYGVTVDPASHAQLSQSPAQTPSDKEPVLTDDQNILVGDPETNRESSIADAEKERISTTNAKRLAKVEEDRKKRKKVQQSSNQEEESDSPDSTGV